MSAVPSMPRLRLVVVFVRADGDTLRTALDDDAVGHAFALDLVRQLLSRGRVGDTLTVSIETETAPARVCLAARVTRRRTSPTGPLVPVWTQQGGA